MSQRTSPPLPSVARALAALGLNVRLARQRRGLTATLLAERAGMSRPTLRAIERGEPGVTLGALANVLQSLGLEGDLEAIGRDDPLGRKLDDAQLERRQRVGRPRKAGKR
jgi:transcriptional regulator with XRE-family HTH domain